MLDDISEVPLDLFEDIDSHNEQYEAGDERDAKEEPVDRRGTEECRAGILDDSHHRVDGQEFRICSGDRGGVDDRSYEEEELNEERQCVTDVTVFYIDRGKDQSTANRCHESDEKEKRYEKQAADVRRISIVEHQADEDGRSNGKIYELGDDRGDGEYEAREVDLGDDCLVADEYIAGVAERAREKLPENKTDIDEDRVGDAVRRHLG